MDLKQIWLWIEKLLRNDVVNLLRDQRGEVGDADSADESSEEGTDEGGQEKVRVDEEDEDDSELIINLDESGDKEKEKAEKEKQKKVEKDSQKAEELGEVKELRSQLKDFEKKEKEWKRDMFQARKEREERAKSEKEKPEKSFTNAQLKEILANNPGDSEILFNVVDYLSEQKAKGTSVEATNAAEMTRNAEGFNTTLKERYPEIDEPNSEIRLDVDKTKTKLGIVDHPYGDYFAVGIRVLEDLPELLEYSFNQGKEAVIKGTADENRKEEIQNKKLPISKKTARKTEQGLTPEQTETAEQMDLDAGQMAAYKKLVGKRPKTISVEG